MDGVLRNMVPQWARNAVSDGRVDASRRAVLNGWLPDGRAGWDERVECLAVHLLPGDDDLGIRSHAGVVVLRDEEPSPESETRLDVVASLEAALDACGGHANLMSVANRRLYDALGELRYVLLLGERPEPAAWQAGKRALADAQAPMRMYEALKPGEVEVRLLLLRARVLAKAWHSWGTP